RAVLGPADLGDDGLGGLAEAAAAPRERDRRPHELEEAAPIDRRARETRCRRPPFELVEALPLLAVRHGAHGLTDDMSSSPCACGPRSGGRARRRAPAGRWAAATRGRRCAREAARSVRGRDGSRGTTPSGA